MNDAPDTFSANKKLPIKKKIIIVILKLNNLLHHMDVPH